MIREQGCGSSLHATNVHEQATKKTVEVARVYPPAYTAWHTYSKAVPTPVQRLSTSNMTYAPYWGGCAIVLGYLRTLGSILDLLIRGAHPV